MALPIDKPLPPRVDELVLKDPASVTNSAEVKEAVSHVANSVNQAKDEAKGATVHQLDPTASPEAKAKAILAASPTAPPVDMSALPSLKTAEGKAFQDNGGAGLPSDANGKDGKLVKTTATGGMVVGEESAVAPKAEVKDDVASPPGAMPEGPIKVREIPAWFAIGWTGQDKTLFLSPDEAKARSVLADFFSDQYYGSWYHNSGIIIFAVLASHFVTLFGGGWAWLIIILAFTATYYQTSIMRTRRNVRDDMAREVAKKGLKADVESATWLNLFMTRFWLIYEPVLSATIVASVDQVLSVSTPAFLDSIRMTTFTLGTKPPHIDHVRTFADTEDDVVMMEWAISFTPNDVQDMTYAAAAKKVNPKIVLNIRVGVGPAVVGKDIIVEDLSFTGVMRIKLKLMNNFPHVQLVDLSFMQPPAFDFILKPVGFDLSIIPGLVPFINSQVHATLGPMMYYPNTFTLNLEQMLSGAPIDTAVGIVAITVYNGRGLKGTKLGGGAPDPYISMSIDGRAELAKTKVKHSTTTPNWNETHYLLLNSTTGILSLGIKDWNEHRADSELGIVNFDLASLHEDGQQEGINGEVILDGKARGTVRFDAVYYPILTQKKLADGTEEPIPETKSGVVRLTVHAAKELDPRGQQINPYFNVSLNDAVVHRSPTLKRTPNPIWERSTEFLVTERNAAVIGVHVFDENAVTTDGSLGLIKIKLNDLFDAQAKELDWFPLTGAKSGRVRVSVEWKPVLMAGAINGAGVFTPPIGIMRLWIRKAVDLKNVEAMTGGKSDPYLRVMHSGIVVTRSLVINNNLDPEWDEILYVPVHNSKDMFVLEVMDYEHTGKDRSLGSADFKIAELLKEGVDKKLAPWLSTGKISRKQSLRTDARHGPKGSIEFEAQFFPCAHLKNVSFTEPVTGTISEEEETIAEIESSVGSSIHPNASVTSVKTTNRPSTAGSASTTTSKKEVKVDPNEGIVVPRAELLTTQSGILAFQIASGQLSRKGVRLEILFDDGYWPTYSSEPARSTHAVWDEIGEAMIRELDFSRVILKLNAADKDSSEQIIASTTIDMNVFLEAALDKPATFTLTDSNGGNRSVVTIAAKYIPVEIELEPRESVNNSGHLRVDLLDAKDVHAADRGGKSDPYAVFELDSKKVFKSAVQKKTLSPVWNENFDVEVTSRVGNLFTVHLFDYDKIGSATSLGRGTIDLASLEPMESSEAVVLLNDIKTNAPRGSIRMKLLFRPAFLARSRQSTSTFSMAGRVATGGGGGVFGAGTVVAGAGVAGVGAVGKLGLGAGKGVFGGAKRLVGGGGDKSSPSSPLSNSNNGDTQFLAGTGVPPVPDLPSSLIGSPSSMNGNGASTPPRRTVGAAGSLEVTIVKVTGSHDPDEKKLVAIRMGGKTIDHTHAVKGDPIVFDQQFTMKTGEGSCDLDFTILRKKTLGSDVVLGSGLVNLWDHVQSDQLTSVRTIEVALSNDQGTLQVSFDWTASRSEPTTPSSLRADDARSIRSTAGSTRKRFSMISPKSRREASVEP